VASEDEELARRIFEEGLNQRDYAVWDEVFAANFVAHSALLGEVHGVEAVKRSFAGFVTPAPDFQASVEDVVAGGDKVVVRVTYRGTDQGGFFGRPATGKRFVLTALYLLRVVEGRVVELWQEADRLGMMQQLGILSAPAPLAA
jgi:predicted ester cyclase